MANESSAEAFTMNTELEKLHTRFAVNRLSLNVNKTNANIFSYRRRMPDEGMFKDKCYLDIFVTEISLFLSVCSAVCSE